MRLPPCSGFGFRYSGFARTGMSFSANPESRTPLEVSEEPMNNSSFRKVVIFAVAALLASLLAAPLFGDVDDPPGRAARLSVVQGNVSLMPSGANDWSQATLNYPLTTGDRLYTDQASRVELEIGNVAVRAWEGSDLTVANLSDEVLQLGLGQGTIRLRVYEILPGNTIEVDTPNGALTIKQPGDYRVETYPNDNATFVTVDRGALEVSGGGVSESVGNQEAVKLTGTDQIMAQFVDLPPEDNFDRWSLDRDRRYETSASARYVSHEVPGYSDLDEYGRWDSNTEYGPVWYPVNVPPNWAPYRFGHWAWVTPWGWTWIDDAPWGFSPFHYGRWVMVGAVWGWVPGPMVVRPVYAPALVAFIGGPHFSISIGIGGGVGWFPLGPREPYNPWYHHSDNYGRQVNVTNIRNITTVINVTNITYVNQRMATSVVPTEAFRTGAPVHRQLVPLNTAEIARAQVIAHPAVAPIAVGTGKPAFNPPRVAPLRTVSATAQRPMQVVRTPPQAGQPSGPPRPAQPSGTFNRPAVPTQPGGPPRPAQPYPTTPTSGPPRPSQPPAVTEQPSAPAQPGAPPRPTPPPSNPPGQTGQSGNSRTFSRPGPTGERTQPAAPPPTAPQVVTKTPPPPPAVPFSQRQPAMQEHPGRPLEPQQIENLRQGKPAGPQRDREVLPHAAPPPKENAKPAPKPEKDKNKEKDKDQKH